MLIVIIRMMVTTTKHSIYRPFKFFTKHFHKHNKSTYLERSALKEINRLRDDFTRGNRWKEVNKYKLNMVGNKTYLR